VLLASGALAAAGTLSVGGVVLAVAAGGLVADVTWLTLARWRGRTIVNAACGLSANPATCVLMVCEKISRFGASYIVVGKFIPGTAPMLAAAAGLAGVSHVRFMAVDAVALLLWASAYTALGWVFASEIETVLVWATSHGRTVVALLASSIMLIMMARLAKARTHRRMHTADHLDGPSLDSAVLESR
jgi:membrane protein DedA with SNARE-associated domain